MRNLTVLVRYNQNNNKIFRKTRLKSAKTKNSCFSHALFIFVCLKCDLFVVHSINITEYEISVIEFKMYPIC